MIYFFAKGSYLLTFVFIDIQRILYGIYMYYVYLSIHVYIYLSK